MSQWTIYLSCDGCPEERAGASRSEPDEARILRIARRWLSDSTWAGDPHGRAIPVCYRVCRPGARDIEGVVTVVYRQRHRECVRRAGGDPDCRHRWRIVSPGPWGRRDGPGVVIPERCSRCGLKRITTTGIDGDLVEYRTDDD